MSPEFIDADSPLNNGIKTADEDRQGLLPADEEYTDDNLQGAQPTFRCDDRSEADIKILIRR